MHLVFKGHFNMKIEDKMNIKIKFMGTKPNPVNLTIKFVDYPSNWIR